MNSERNRLGLPFSIRGILLASALLLSCAAHAKSLAEPAKGVPDLEYQEILIKTTLLTFNDANITANYAVLHDKLCKPFRDKFTPEQLADAFKGFRDKHIQIDDIAGAKPVAAQDAAINDDGVLRLQGAFATTTGRAISYDLKFIKSDDEWKALGINVDVKGHKD
jgi:hypothetical protein